MNKMKFNGLTLDISNYIPNRKMSHHAHEFAAFSFILCGSYDETIEKKHVRICKPNMTVFHPSNETHSVNFHNVTTKIVRVSLNNRWLEKFNEPSFTFNQPATLESETTSNLFKKIYTEFCTPDSFSSFAIEGLTLELFAVMGRNASCRKEENKTPRWLDAVREMLHENYSGETTLQSLAESAGVHPVYLARQFRKFYHMTVGDYIRQLRIEKASHQLSNTKQSISEIALATGFYDQSHFSNVFKKHTGMTPVEFRLNKQGS